jgi:hypothetical protein
MENRIELLLEYGQKENGGKHFHTAMNSYFEFFIKKNK